MSTHIGQPCTCPDCAPTEGSHMTDLERFEDWAHARAADPELDELRREVAELEEMLTAATDVAVQRGKTIDAIRERALYGSSGEVEYLPEAIAAILDGGA